VIGNLADACRVFLEEGTDAQGAAAALLPEAAAFYLRHGKERFRLRFPSRPPEISLPGLTGPSEMVRVIMNREGLAEYKKFLTTNFGHFTRYYPLTSPQRGIWFTEKLFPGTSIANVAATLRIKGNIDYALLEKSVRHTIETNEAFRLRIVEVDGEPRQYEEKHEVITPEFIDFSGKTRNALYEWEETRTRFPFRHDGS
jgi:hypothetical protein